MVAIFSVGLLSLCLVFPPAVDVAVAVTIGAVVPLLLSCFLAKRLRRACLTANDIGLLEPPVPPGGNQVTCILIVAYLPVLYPCSLQKIC